MKYVDWVERVLGAVLATADEGQAVLIGAPFARVAEALGLDGTSPEFERSREAGALVDALIDLRDLGILEDTRGFPQHARLTQEGRRLAAGSLRSLWADIAATFVTEDQRQYLAVVAELAETREDGYAALDWVKAGTAFERLGWEPDTLRAVSLTKDLTGIGLARSRLYMGGMESVNITTTYAGLVLATEVVESELQALVRTLLPEGETTTVEFKRRLDLDTRDGKGEFVHDVLALATTKASGRRRTLVIGIDDRTSTAVESLSPRVTQDRIEDILNAHAAPVPGIRLRTVDWEGMTEGVLEVLRDPAQVPYRFSRNIGRFAKGDVFVRHGSHVEPPTSAELEALVEEGERARKAPSEP